MLLSWGDWGNDLQKDLFLYQQSWLGRVWIDFHLKPNEKTVHLSVTFYRIIDAIALMVPKWYASYHVQYTTQLNHH